jgi:tyrosinase
VGGWGDPNEDYEVFDGGFSKLHVSYPSPHILRRKFTLRPFNLPLPFFTEPLKEANITFTADKVERLLHLPVGDFRWFQAEVEAFQVRA